MRCVMYIIITETITGRADTREYNRRCPSAVVTRTCELEKLVFLPGVVRPYGQFVNSVSLGGGGGGGGGCSGAALY